METLTSEQALEYMSSPVSANVYTDGSNATVFYSWQKRQAPPEGWELAGTFIVIPAESGTGWRTKARAGDEKWCAVMEQAMPHFETEVRKLLALLNEQGLGLQDLRQLLTLGEGLDELEKNQN